MHQTVRFYNRASAQEIQDVSGCTEEQAQKIIDLRPFGTIDELRDTLHQEKGLSARFIQNYVDMVDGYSIVDQIIGEIEELGASLKDIIDVWKGNSINNDDNNEDAGVHLATINADTKKQQQSTQLYNDAMEGFLTEQPALINKDMKLKDYQLLGVNWLLLLYRKRISGILADEMGLGKTAQVISFLSRIYELGDPGPHLIIVPTSTLENWLREFERFCPELKVYSYYGSQAERSMLRAEWQHEFDGQVIVSTYNVATGSNDDRRFLRRMNPRSVILDEGHMVRNCTSKRYQQLMTIHAPFRLLLTGTPLQNNLQELVSLLTFILPDMLLEYEEEVSKIFKIKTVSRKESTAQMLSQQRIARAKKMMTPFVLRRRKTDVLKDLPQKFQVVERCQMTETQQELYDTILRTSRQSYRQAIDASDKKKGALDQFKNMVMHLRKAANHPMLFRNIYDDAKLKSMAKDIMKEEQYWDANEDYIYEDMTVMTDFELDKLCRNHKSIKQYALQNKEWMNAGKVEKLKKLLPAMKQEGRKVLIFSQFTQLLDILERVMDTLQLRFLRLDGATKMEDRQVLIDEFNEDEEITVFLLSTKAGGMGINLTAANVVVLYDMDFNPQNDRQAEDRAHRVGQTQDVTVYKFVTDQTVEENILSMAEIKLRLDRSVSGLGEEGEQVEENDQGDQTETVHSLLKAVLLS
ncbi:SNF2 family DNA-dependent ATPase [Lichtheimia hyalospora FSU 10163]|nr:SNF2 family DNA-dependent ATPase [Lichtheimia hyalospora FSU 10163]